jgi:hypothetical protein|tara:strand:- start:4069 stop:4266 length:198 start_codon:yes stop_codon:yes gene_type:complete
MSINYVIKSVVGGVTIVFMVAFGEVLLLSKISIFWGWFNILVGATAVYFLCLKYFYEQEKTKARK